MCSLTLGPLRDVIVLKGGGRNSSPFASSFFACSISFSLIFLSLFLLHKRRKEVSLAHGHAAVTPILSAHESGNLRMTAPQGTEMAPRPMDKPHSFPFNGTILKA